MSSELGVALPFWLDRPDEEALEIAVVAERAGIETVWVGEMTSFDAFALATAIGQRTDRVRLQLGPLAITVRTPVGIALGVSSVSTLTGRRAEVALGASSPVIAAGWHDRPWDALARRMAETVEALRIIFRGERVELDGRHIRSHGFKLRRPQPDTPITVAAFGPAMTRTAARHADQVVLNLVTTDVVASVREQIDGDAAGAGRPRPRLAVWVPVALEPRAHAAEQLKAQLAVYLRPPGYGEMFAAAGHGALVERARAGAPRAELTAAIPLELISQVGAIGSSGEVAARIAEYHAAGADHVAVVPSTVEDSGGRAVLASIGESS